MEFVKKNWKIILVGFAGLIIGFALQVYANYRSEQRIIAAITTKIEELKAKQSTARLSAEDQNKLIELEAQLKLLKS